VGRRARGRREGGSRRSECDDQQQQHHGREGREGRSGNARRSVNARTMTTTRTNDSNNDERWAYVCNFKWEKNVVVKRRKEPKQKQTVWVPRPWK